METTRSLNRRLEALEAAVPVDGCQTCAARPVFTLEGPAAPCAECGREPFAFTIAIDRLDPQPEDAA